ncbi:hypothetical protein SSP35_44_00010 [Streptomyces sp. NBRC 110611]|uniref:hypothetical protein n=1 Tax=Streptomyces sp. NBRC 110611 TaxID=1621259 RepID=UPI00082B3BE5|nr:hypothetical protein [Streptomyces sp. NBRC 110611]GAU71516.1 hypothetical protein SSP35_44_00010 [Streptomyces sp. NBRC 110611]
MKPHGNYAVHRLLTEALTYLADPDDAAVPHLHDLLATLIVQLSDRDLLGSRPCSLGLVVDEAAACLLNVANPQRTTLPFDQDVLARLGEVDRLPLAERRRLLETATRLAAPTAQR